MIRAIRNWIGHRKGFWHCARCHDTWDWKEAHVTDYEDGRGCFPLCEECWSALTPEQRLPYYYSLVGIWMAQMPSLIEEYNGSWNKIRTAVEAGL